LRSNAFAMGDRDSKQRMKRSSHRMRPETMARAERLRPIMDGLQAMSANQAAAVLNRRNVPSPKGGQWSATQIISIRKRLAASRRTSNTQRW
jgi:hypothetical protein